MKKAAVFILALCLLFTINSYALNNPLLQMRERFLQESNNIKILIRNSKDVVLLTSMWDSCFIAMTQLDAYFSLIGIFESIKKEDLTESSVNYLLNWLEEVKKTNTVNKRSLSIAPVLIDNATKVAAQRMDTNFSDFNKTIDREINRLLKLREGVRRKIVR